MIDSGAIAYKPLAEGISLVARHDIIAVWVANLDFAQNQSDALQEYLSIDELARAARFHFDKDRRRFVAARGILRSILGRYLNRHPSDISLVYGSAGKPRLSSNDLSFNLSHSHQLALYTVTREREVGVDIEFIRSVSDIDQVAAHSFSAREYAEWQQLPETEKQVGFFNCWTRKEAYIKALGEGLSHPLDQFDVSLKPGQAARLLHVEDNPVEVKRWSLQAINLHEGYVAALAVEGTGWSLECWQWDSIFASQLRVER